MSLLARARLAAGRDSEAALRCAWLAARPGILARFRPAFLARAAGLLARAGLLSIGPGAALPARQRLRELTARFAQAFAAGARAGLGGLLLLVTHLLGELRHLHQRLFFVHPARFHPLGKLLDLGRRALGPRQMLGVGLLLDQLGRVFQLGCRFFGQSAAQS